MTPRTDGAAPVRRALDQEQKMPQIPLDQEQTGPRRCKAAAARQAGTDGTTRRCLQLPAMEAL